MTDYIPNPDPRDVNRHKRHDIYPEGGRSGYALVALLGIIAVFGGLIYFGTPSRENVEQAQNPPATATPVDQQRAPGLPLPARPVPPATAPTPAE